MEQKLFCMMEACEKTQYSISAGTRDNFMAQVIMMSFHYRTHLCVCNCVFQPMITCISFFFVLTIVVSSLCLSPNANWLTNNLGPRIEFRGSAEIGVLVHASLNRPMLCFNIVWIPPDVKATFPELLLQQGTVQWVNEKKHRQTHTHREPHTAHFLSRSSRE